MTKYANNIGVRVPELLLPNKDVDMTKWAVVACDQFTSQPDYWNETEKIVGDAPSTLRIMLPELYLDKPDEAERIASINAHMKESVEKGVLENKGEGFAYVVRSVDGKTRKGLIVALDLENYDYTKGSTTLIRATEGTIVERIPPRLRIRKDAPLEMPHILVLIDDPERTVIEPIGEKLDKTGARVFLVNTGWCGHKAGDGKRMSLKYTRAMLTAALTGELEKAEFELDPIFNVLVPKSCPNVPDEVLSPRAMWKQEAGEAEYEKTAKDLAARFVKNFEKYTHMPQHIIDAGPKA